MEVMDIMDLDEQSRLFDSDYSNRASTSAYPIVNDAGTNQICYDLKERGLPIVKGNGGQVTWAKANVLQRSKEDASKGNSDSNQKEIRVGNMKAININLGNADPEEEILQSLVDHQKDLGRKNKVCKDINRYGENYISVFIGNLPPFANNRWIFDKFIKLGRVADYYVSGRLSKFSKKPFGFVRFHSLEDANKAVDHFNGAWVDGFKLEVELARFPRRMMNEEDDRNTHIRREDQRLVHMGSKDGIRSTVTQKVHFNPNKTFAQALLGSTDDKLTDAGNLYSSTIKVKAVVKECGWLNVSVVAKIKWGASIGRIRKELLSHIKGLESVSRLGIRRVILSFSSLEDRNNAIILGDWLGLVEEAREWRGEMVCADRLWNISCIGIPIIAWNIESFTSIAEIWGSMVYIDDATLKGDDFSTANFVIEAESEVSNTSIDLLVGNEVFQIKIVGVMMEEQKCILDEDVNPRWFNEGEFPATVMISRDRPYGTGVNTKTDCVGVNKASIADVTQNSESLDGVSVKERNFDVRVSCDVVQNQVLSNSDDLLQLNEDAKGILNTKESAAIDLIRDDQEVCVRDSDRVYPDGSIKKNNAGLVSEMVDSRDDSVSLVDKGINAMFHEQKAHIQANSDMFQVASDKVEKEVEAMMYLGNSLDILNASFFEEAVRQATLDEIEEDQSSIGVRVRSKRKSAGKSKVYGGCKFKKKG